MLYEKRVDIIVGLVVSIVAVCITVKKRALTSIAALTAFVFVMLISLFSTKVEVAFLIMMYFALLGIEKLYSKRKKINIPKNEKTRSAYQIWANGALPIVFLILRCLSNDSLWRISYYAAILEIFTDSVASSLGKLSLSAPRDICTWKMVDAGSSGGITFLGMCTSALSCALLGCFVLVVYKWNYTIYLIVAVAAYIGMISDSIIGSRFQLKYQCQVCGKIVELKEHCEKFTEYKKGIKIMTNSTVNLLCTGLAGILAYVGGMICLDIQ